MTASAQIGTLRGVPDSVSISLDSGVSVKDTSLKSNFRSVLEQYHASRESASETDDTEGAAQQKQKDSDPTTTLAIPQPVTPVVEAPRLILPFTTSITLRQDANSSADDTSTQDASASIDDNQTSPAAADRDRLPTAIPTTSPIPTILRGSLDLLSLPRVSDAKTNRASAGAQPKIEAKPQAKSKDSVPSPTADAPLDQTAPLPETAPAAPSIPIRIASSTTLEQAATVVQNRSTVNEAPYTVSASTSDRAIAYQYRPSNEHPTETAVIHRASQEPREVSDPTPAVIVPTSFTNPVTNTVEQQTPIHPPPGSNVPRQDAKAFERGSAAPQDSSAASGTDLKNALPATVERADDTGAAPNSGAIAFAARLTPTAELQPPASESTLPAAPLPGSQTPPQFATPAAAKQIPSAADLPADAHSGESGGQPNKEKASDLFAKPDTLLPQMHVAATDQTAILANNHASTSPLSPAAQMDRVIDPPAAAPKTNNDITVRIPDSTGQGTAVRFVERAGEIHVSVRTSDVEMAQSLRGGLNDLVNHLEDGGIRTEVWQPGSASNASTSHNDSHQPFADPDGSNGRQYSIRFELRTGIQAAEQTPMGRRTGRLHRQSQFQGDDTITMASIGSVIGSGADASANSSASTPSSSSALANESTFLQLLVAQIKNQDPTQPMDSTAFLSQLAQFSQLEQLVGIRQDIENPSSSTTATNPAASTTGV